MYRNFFTGFRILNIGNGKNVVELILVDSQKIGSEGRNGNKVAIKHKITEIVAEIAVYFVSPGKIVVPCTLITESLLEFAFVTTIGGENLERTYFCISNRLHAEMTELREEVIKGRRLQKVLRHDLRVSRNGNN